MNKAFTVARFEYLEKVRSKAFLISLFLMPLIMIAFGIVPSLLASRPDTEPRTIGVIDYSGEILEPLSKLLEERYKLPNGQPNYVLRNINPFNNLDADVVKQEAINMVTKNEIEGFLIIPATIASDTIVDYRSISVGNFRTTERLSKAIKDVLVDKKLKQRGLDPALIKELTSPFELNVIKLSKTGEEEEAGFTEVFFTSYIFLMMLFFLILTSGQLLVRSVIEEKTNRLVEVLMSSCSPRDLMIGKILGLSGLGFTQLGFWGLMGLAIALKSGVTMIAGPSALLLGVYFIIGWLLYAAIFVAAGSPVSTEQEAQQLTSYLSLLLVMPMMVAIPVMQDPDALYVKILTMIPLLTPTMMAIRIPIQMPSLIEILVSLSILTASAYGMMWVAGKVFRTAMLAYGKRPSIKELIHIVRTS